MSFGPSWNDSVNILLIHNSYQQPGGEDRVSQQESRLLQSHGHRTSWLTASNDGIRGVRGRLSTAMTASFSPQAKRDCLRMIDQVKPDVVHVHNLFPLLTPSVLDACAERRIPVVMTLHNYRLLCPGAILMRDGRICTTCLDSTPYQGVIHRCYRESLLGSFAAARVIAVHRARRTWDTKVQRFVALTHFGKKLFEAGGLPSEKIVVKPNFCETTAVSVGTSRKGALFVGRLSREKGVDTLLSGWKTLGHELRLAGSGEIPAPVVAGSNVRFLGPLDSAAVASEMNKAEFLVLPSQWFEGFPMVIVEAFAAGLPVLASRLGAMAEVIEDGLTGLHFDPGDPRDLAVKAKWLFDHPEQRRQMGLNARADYEGKYTPDRNYEMLMNIYHQATDEATRQYGDR